MYRRNAPSTNNGGLIVVDTSPLTAVSDAFPLFGKVDGVIIVGRVGCNRRDVAQRPHETLTGAGAPLLGVVANGLKSGRLGGDGRSVCRPKRLRTCVRMVFSKHPGRLRSSALGAGFCAAWLGVGSGVAMGGKL